MKLETWPGALEAYATAQRAANRTPGTIKVHRHYLSQLRADYRQPWRITTGQLRTLLATEHWSPSTRKSCRSSLVGFYGWGHGEGLVDDNPAATLAPVTVRRGRPKPTPHAVLRPLLATLDDRLALMVMLACFAGLRRSEIAAVHARDLGDVVDDLEGDRVGLLWVRGKGSKVRVIPVTDELLLRRLEALDGWAFPSRASDSHLTPDYVGRLLSGAMPEGWAGHSLRHRYATEAYAGNRDLLAVSELLGHSRVETTQIYVEPPAGAMVEAARAAASRIRTAAA